MTMQCTLADYEIEDSNSVNKNSQHLEKRIAWGHS